MADYTLGYAFKNAEIERYIVAQMRDIRRLGNLDVRHVQQFLISFYKHIPQLNEQTKMQIVESWQRSMVVAEWPSNVPMVPHAIWIAKPGIKAALTRQRVRIHKWLVDHRYHPADKPKNWREWTSNAGMMAIYPDVPVSIVHQRTIDLEWFGMNFGFDMDFGGGERYRAQTFAICCAYDGATDTLYVRQQ